MNKAEALALLEYNAQPSDYITDVEFKTAFKEAIKNKEEAQFFNKPLLYGAEVQSFIHNKMQYVCICIMRQDWTGDWYEEGVVHFKQKHMTYEEIVALMNYTPDLQDSDIQ